MVYNGDRRLDSSASLFCERSSAMPECVPDKCSAHDEITKSVARASAKMTVLLALIGLGLAVVTICVTVAVGAGDKAAKVRQDFEVHSAKFEEKIKSIEEGVVRIDRRAERIEELLREK